MRLEQLDRLIGHLAVRVLRVRPGRVRQKRHGGAQTALGRVVDDVDLEGGLVASRRIEPLQPRHPVIQAVGADVPRIAVVVHLSDAGHVVTVAQEHLRQRQQIRPVLAEVILQVEHPRAVRPQTRQQRRAARTAQRKLAIGPVEPHAAGREPVDARRLDQRVTEAPEVIVHVIHGDEQDIELGRGRPCRPARHERHEGNQTDPHLHATILLLICPFCTVACHTGPFYGPPRRRSILPPALRRACPERQRMGRASPPDIFRW